jgi:hypothetical protein
MGRVVIKFVLKLSEFSPDELGEREKAMIKWLELMIL